MPNPNDSATLGLTQEDLDYLQQQGIDPSAVHVMTDDEIKNYQSQQIARKGIIAGGVIPTLKAHAGSLVGGGLAGTAGWTAGAALAPETGLLSLAIPAIASAVTAFGGSALGQQAQKAVVPTQIEQQLEEEAQGARQVFPKTSMATDIVAGALAAGGRPSIRPAVSAVKGLIEGVGNEGLTAAAIGGSSSPIYKQAIQNVITGNALNTAINAGVQLATTGDIDPKELAGSAIAGAFFSEPSPLGKAINRKWQPLPKETGVRPSIVSDISPDGENIADVQAYQKVAKRAATAMESQVNEDLTSHVDWAQQQEAAYEQQQQEAADAQIKADKVASDYHKVNWLTQNQDGSYLIPDKQVKLEYVRRNHVNPKTEAARPEQAALIRAQNEALPKTPLNEMRQNLYEEDLASRDPKRYAEYQQEQQDDYNRRYQQMSQLNEQLKQAEALKQQQAAAQSQPQPEPTTQQPPVQPQQETQPISKPEPQPQQKPVESNEDLQSQLASELGSTTNKKPARQPIAKISTEQPEDLQAQLAAELNQKETPKKPKTQPAPSKPPEADLIMTPKGLMKKSDWELIQEKERLQRLAAGNTENKFQTTTTSNEPQIPVTSQLKEEAGKANVGVGRIQGNLVNEQGQPARGVQYGNKRLIGLSNLSIPETGYHELTHQMFSDLRNNSDPTLRKLGDRAVTAYGSEEAAATAIGKLYQATVEGQETGLPAKLVRYFKDVAAATRVAKGSNKPEDLSVNLVRRMTQRHGAQDITQPESFKKGGNVFQTAKTPEEIEADIARYKEIQNEMKGLMRSGKLEGPELQDVFQRMENLKNEYDGMPPHHTTENKFQTANPDEELPSRFKPTQAAIERIKYDEPNETGRKLSAALFNVFKEKQNKLGEWWNPIALSARNTTKTQQDNVRDVLLREVNDKAFHRSDLQTPEEQDLYDTIRQELLSSAKYRQAINEPVYREGQPTPAQIDPYYYPTTTDPKVAEVFRRNTDQPEVERLSEDYIQQAMKHGYSEEESNKMLQQMIDSFQGSALKGSSDHGNFFNAARKAQGIPLPESWQRGDLMRNLEAYHRRLSTDVAYYHNVETDPKVMASLGYKKDPWGNPIYEPGVRNITGGAAESVMSQLKGEHVGYAERTQHAGEALATTLMLGPLTEIHKAFSSLAQTFTYAENPMQAARMFTHAIGNMADAWTHVLRTGYVQLDAAKARDFMDSNLAMFERLRGLSKMVRNLYSLGANTERVTKSFLQAAGEYLIPEKVQLANEGNKNAIRLLKSIDPDYVVGKDYQGDELQKVASEFANLIHGSKDARTLPTWMLHDNEVSAFFKLSSWNVAQTNHFFRNVVTPLKQGDPRPLLMTTLGTVLGGAVIKELRERLAAKKSPIPDFNEIINSEGGLASHKGLAAYNLATMAGYAGFAGILSTVSKVPFDFVYKNAAAGATFPAEEVLSNTAVTAKNIVEALSNDPTANNLEGYIRIGTQALLDEVKTNIQLARIGINQMAEHNELENIPGLYAAGSSEEYRKHLADKLSMLRRWKMVEGLPYEAQSQMEGNPYLNMNQKEFKREQNIGEAVKELTPLVHSIIENYGNNPELMMQKFKGLKESQYETMPSLEDTPIAFSRYLRFLKDTQGNEAATEHMMDYMHHEMINQAKASMVP